MREAHDVVFSTWLSLLVSGVDWLFYSWGNILGIYEIPITLGCVAIVLFGTYYLSLRAITCERQEGNQLRSATVVARIGLIFLILSILGFFGWLAVMLSPLLLSLILVSLYLITLLVSMATPLISIGVVLVVTYGITVEIKQRFWLDETDVVNRNGHQKPSS